MRLYLVAWVTLLFSLGCPPQGPVGPPDVLDGGPAFDSAGLSDGSLTPCQAACARLQREGCPTLADCPTVYGDIEKDRLRPMPNGQPLTCMAVVQAVKLTDVGLRCP